MRQVYCCTRPRMRCATTPQSCTGIFLLRPPCLPYDSAGGSADMTSSWALHLPLRPAVCTSRQPFPMPIFLLQWSMILLHPARITRPIHPTPLPPTTFAPCQRQRLHKRIGQNRRFQSPVNSQNTATFTMLVSGGVGADRLIPAATLRSQHAGLLANSQSS